MCVSASALSCFTLCQLFLRFLSTILVCYDLQGYRKILEEGKISEEEAKKEIRIYDFLSSCDQDDFCRMVDSSAFNDIIRAFLKMAVVNAELEEEQQGNVLNQLRWIFSEKSAKEVLQNDE